MAIQERSPGQRNASLCLASAFLYHFGMTGIQNFIPDELFSFYRNKQSVSYKEGILSPYVPGESLFFSREARDMLRPFYSYLYVYDSTRQGIKAGQARSDVLEQLRLNLE